MARQLLLGMLLAAAIMVGSCSAASAQSYMAALTSLAPCLSFIQGTASTPSSSCCTQLANVFQSLLLCLCQVTNGCSAPFGITVNQTLALVLPCAGNLQTPSPALCNSVAGGPAASPSSPAPTAPSPPSTPSTPSLPSNPSAPALPTTPSNLATPSPQTPSTSAAPAAPWIPSPSGHASAGTSNRVGLSIFFALLFAASFASTRFSF